MEEISIIYATKDHLKYAQDIVDAIEEATKVTSSGLAKRTKEYIEEKINAGKGVIALCGDRFAGFCYIESWEHELFVANSGLIVKPEFRKLGIAKKVKEKTFQLSREKYPDAKIFGLTTSLAVMRINSALGYLPVTYSELTTDINFWKGCVGCANFDILCRCGFTKCLCTGMVYDPTK